MYDVKSSLYEGYEKDEIEKLTEGVMEEISRNEATSYEEKLVLSMELESLYKKKLEDVAPFIRELKERANELNQLKKDADDKAKASQLDPKNQELREEAMMLVEEYSKIVEEITGRIEKTLRAGLDKLYASQQFDHEFLLETLKDFRTEIKEELVKQKEAREKILMVMEQEMQDKVDSPIGKEFSNILLNEIKTYPESMQDELKKRKLDKTEEVLLTLKTLTDVYGYERTRMTPDYIEKEMDNIKSRIKLYIPAYENGNKDLKELAALKISIVKLKLIKEAKEEVADKIQELKEKKKELEDTLKEDEVSRELSDLDIMKDLINEKIAELKEEKEKIYTLAEGVENEEQAKELDKINNEIKENEEELKKAEDRIKELNKKPEQVIEIGGLEGLAQLLGGMYGVKTEVAETKEEQMAIDNEEDDKSIMDVEEEVYVPLTEEEKAEIHDEIDKIDVELKDLEERLERLESAVKIKTEISDNYNELAEEQEERANKITDEVAKYKLLKDLTEAFDRSRDVSYQRIYM